MSRTDTRPDVSVVVPTYCEAENLVELVPRLGEVFAEHGLVGEIIVVDDDSPDGTPDVCRELAESHAIRCRVRKSERGLSSAVIEGLRMAEGRLLVVMDADLSHPPEAIPTMLAELESGEADFVIGSRYVDGGSTADDWGPLRWLNSKVATLLARPLTSAKDPMAGFFALRPETFRACESELAPLGYKIGLELIVKGNCTRVVEVPIHFSDRRHGDSKLTIAEQLKYLRHIGRLYAYQFPALTCFALFAAVGLSGIAVDLTTFAVLLALEVPFGISRAGAILLAMTWNFVLNREVTFGDRARGPILAQYATFCSACGLGAAANWSVSHVVHEHVAFFADHRLLAACSGIAVGFLFNYVLCRRFVFGVEREPVVATPKAEKAAQLPARDSRRAARPAHEFNHAATQPEELLR